jgi:transcriptional antiterminator NusG
MGKWYILHVRTGYEEKVVRLLEGRVNRENRRISRIIVPTEDVAEVSKGERIIKTRKYWPGYVLVEISDESDNELTWHEIRNTPGILKFLGAGKANPVTMGEGEVDRILRELEDKKGKPTPKVEFGQGDKVEIVDGPFVNFTGIVEEVFPDKERLKVSVSIFGRGTLLELAYWQVERI